MQLTRSVVKLKMHIFFRIESETTILQSKNKRSNKKGKEGKKRDIIQDKWKLQKKKDIQILCGGIMIKRFGLCFVFL